MSGNNYWGAYNPYVQPTPQVQPTQQVQQQQQQVSIKITVHQQSAPAPPVKQPQVVQYGYSPLVGEVLVVGRTQSPIEYALRQALVPSSFRGPSPVINVSTQQQAMMCSDGSCVLIPHHMMIGSFGHPYPSN
jgi:hypothetical protein